MCGIVGVVHRDRDHLPSRDELRAMADTLVHRGPDGAGEHVEGGVGFAHRRLAVIDPEGSSQPLGNEDDTVVVTYNGEIYNYVELRRELEQRGHRLRTAGDTEVLVHLWEEEGPAFIERLNGMFALAIWDRRSGTLFLARDRLGIKPLYWTFDGERLVFGSEIKALLACPGVTAGVNEEALSRHLQFNTLYGEETLFRGIFEFLPGHTLLWRPFVEARPRVTRSWDLPEDDLDSGEEPDSEALAEDRLEALLSESVRRRLVADVPVGVFLSGGLDSSLLVALAARHVTGELATFSIGFPEAEGNEFPWSRRVAEQYGTRHHEIVLSEEDFLDALPDLIWHQDEPIKHNNSVALYFLSRATKEKATVILTGEGSDELFLGYRKYRLGLVQRRASEVMRWVLPGVFGEAVADLGPRLSRRKWATRVWGKLAHTPARLAASSSAVMDPVLMRSLVPGHAAARGQAFLTRAFESGFPSGGGDFLRRYSRMDLKGYLVSLLNKQDRMSMAASIESRVPFLDHELVEWAYRLPTSLKVKEDRGKWILKRVAERFLPRDLVHRKKLGFPVPVYGWLTSGRFRDRAREVLLDRRTLERGVVDGSGVEAYLDRLDRGVYGTGVDATYPLWTLLNLELWWRRCVESETASSYRV